MAYTEKYFITFCNKKGDNCRISIMKDEVVISPIELTANEFPITISYDSTEDFKFSPKIDSKAEISLVFKDGEGVQLEDFADIDDRSLKIEFRIESDLEWTGFVIPDEFKYDLKSGYYYGNLTADDGLSTLESLLFKTDNNEFYGTQDFGFNDGFEFPFILIATEILRKLDLGIDLWTCVDVYEKNMIDRTSDSRDSDPLAISYVNTKTYINDTSRKDIAYFEDINEAWDCKQVLENLLYIWGCQLYQQQGVWRIKRVNINSKIGLNYPIEVSTGVFLYKALFSPEETDVFYENKDLYTDTNDIEIGSDCSPAIAGFYKLVGIGKIVELNDSGIVIDVVNYTIPTYYWHKYNNTAGYIGREVIEDVITIPCSNKDKFILGDGAIIRFDEVYKQFRVNFEYTFIREGDSPINLLKNGSFTEDYEQYGQLEAPPNWQRWRLNNKWYPRLRTETLTSQDTIDTGGYTKGLLMGRQFGNANTPSTDPNPATWASLRQTGISFSETVKSMELTCWIKFKYQSSNRKVIYYTVLKSFFTVPSPLKNSQIYVLQNSNSDNYDLDWVVYEGDSQLVNLQLPLGFFILDAKKDSPEWVEDEYDDYKWYSFKMRVAPPPEIGTLEFNIHGICATSGRKSANFPPFRVKKLNGDVMKDISLPTVRENWVDQGGDIPRPIFTGLFFGYIPDPNQEVPASDYIYANGNVNYSFQRDPIRVFNGDTVSPEIVSGIRVPLNTSGGMNFWDTSDNDFGLTAIGMIQCKSIMAQYSALSRLFDGTISSNELRYGGVVTFEALPNINFMILRGTFNSKQDYWQECTFAQVNVGAIKEGGIINGDTLLGKWVETGNVRCIKVDGENTGVIEIEQQNINTNSETFGNFRWYEGGVDTVSCPIGEPSKYLWGVDNSSYDSNNFLDYTVLFDEDGIVQVPYNSDGGKYIYFLHLASLGSVNRISNEFQTQIISSFTYLSNVTINGYIYRVLRQNFVTSSFEDFTLTFYFD